jgi:hypothetical protein
MKNSNYLRVNYPDAPKENDRIGNSLLGVLFGKYLFQKLVHHPVDESYARADDIQCIRCYLTREAIRRNFFSHKNLQEDSTDTVLNSVEEGFMSSYMNQYSDSETFKS